MHFAVPVLLGMMLVQSQDCEVGRQNRPGAVREG